MTDNKPYTDRLTRYQRAISDLEGWCFGGSLRFRATGYLETLHVSLKPGWVEVGNFEQLPDLRQFADDLNAATKPVVEAYAKKLRQAMANECTRVAAVALMDKDVTK